MIQPADDLIDLQTDEAAAAERTGDGYLPARMINEAVYCPRLFYLMHVEGQFEHNRDTVEGLQVHSRVDQKTDRLKSPAKPPQPSLFELESAEDLPGDDAAKSDEPPAVGGEGDPIQRPPVEGSGRER